ncbi:hypothetical protein DdX_11513 [Ditylenchus destructor]|uniref:Uncharacterized protein n=1 Tax=Ditylenchus destructor TaxID=166010 RepID=A0AAD4R4I5_9BILA|nr:hypothetical protein DdX_11513 [Ditylenchus destructor]
MSALLIGCHKNRKAKRDKAKPVPPAAAKKDDPAGLPASVTAPSGSKKNVPPAAPPGATPVMPSPAAQKTTIAEDDQQYEDVTIDDKVGAAPVAH